MSLVGLVSPMQTVVHMLFHDEGLFAPAAEDRPRFLLFAHWPPVVWVIEMFRAAIGVDYAVIRAMTRMEERSIFSKLGSRSIYLALLTVDYVKWLAGPSTERAAIRTPCELESGLTLTRMAFCNVQLSRRREDQEMVPVEDEPLKAARFLRAFRATWSLVSGSSQLDTCGQQRTHTLTSAGGYSTRNVGKYTVIETVRHYECLEITPLSCG
ncbi:hypothetical protein BO71DRAFT_430413 [Aspergillus ellipticus CBS 707.79]|uniref:Uncharacterized protein n=1 Tax=Aspergillus ellipticus CBS 707.79 TaxID=1448320 RepID=A0A319D9E7_9EURO|nr:hypothetical protein BO71DRAFT_430413 [Aspergillus ellipticus CBS 707.79]